MEYGNRDKFPVQAASPILWSDELSHGLCSSRRGQSAEFTLNLLQSHIAT